MDADAFRTWGYATVDWIARYMEDVNKLQNLKEPPALEGSVLTAEEQAFNSIKEHRNRKFNESFFINLMFVIVTIKTTEMLPN